MKAFFENYGLELCLWAIAIGTALAWMHTAQVLAGWEW